MKSRLKLGRFGLVPGWSAAVLLVGEVLLFSWLLAPTDGRPHSFANLENFALVLKYSAVFSLGAIGAALIIGSGGIDLAPGAVMALASVVAGHLLTNEGWSWGNAALTSLAVGTAFGALAAVLVTLLELPPFVATLGTMGVARGSAFLITEGRFYDLSAHLPRDFQPVGVPLNWWPGLLVLLCTTVFHLLLTRTALGRHILAVGSNPVAARYAGVRVAHVQAFVYVCGGFLAALAGVLLAFVQGQGKADLALGYELDIIAAAVIGGASLSGGRASVVGAVFGALIFGVLRNALTQFPGGTFADRLVLGIAVLVVVVLDRLATRKALQERG